MSLKAYTFLWKGTDPRGEARHVRMETQSAQEARGLLTEQGWTNLELLIDEVGSVAASDVETPDMGECRLTPDEEAAFLRGKNPLRWQLWLECLNHEAVWAVVLIGVGLATWGIIDCNSIPVMLGIIGIILALLVWPLVAIYVLGPLFAAPGSAAPLGLYSRLLKAKVWGRWEEVLHCVEGLRNARDFTGTGVGEIELTRSRAQALASLGRLEEGITEMWTMEQTTELPRWLYLSQLADVYDKAKAFDESLVCSRRAAEEKPDSSALWIDLASAHVRRFNHSTDAREALARCESLEISGAAKDFLPFVRGMIEWREAKYSEAAANFKLAINRFRNQRSKNELFEGLVLLSEAHLCAMNRQLGNHQEAERLFSKVEKFLVAHRETELLQACRG